MYTHGIQYSGVQQWNLNIAQQCDKCGARDDFSACQIWQMSLQQWDLRTVML